MPVDYQHILNEVYSQVTTLEDIGKAADYIPELGRINPDKYGIHISCLDGRGFSVGDSHERFSIQSISKVLSLALALDYQGENIWTRVGVEPSGDAFNSLVLLEYEKGIPRNPFINSGALVVCDILVSQLNNPKEDYLAFVRNITGNETIDYNRDVAASEKKHGHRNSALVYLMKSFGNIHNDVEVVLDFYFHTCAIEMTCEELANTFLPFANEGKISNSNRQLLSSSNIKRINAIMLTCGFYDQAGEFSFLVGLPGKSGVGGGVVAIEPGKLSVAVWSPRLNKKGNSYKGMKSLEYFTTKTGFSIF